MNTCIVCGLGFKKKRGAVGKYCGYDCYWKTMSGKAIPERKTGELKSCRVCNSDFYVPKNRIAALYCSNKCRGVSLVGRRISPETEFRAGRASERKGKKFPEMTNEGNPGWKGDSVGYHGLHKWVKRHRGSPKACCRCGGEKNLQWANISHKYLRELSDFMSLCVRCHKQYDMEYRRHSFRRVVAENTHA